MGRRLRRFLVWKAADLQESVKVRVVFKVFSAEFKLVLRLSCRFGL